MKRNLLDILCCPTCKGFLTLDVESEQSGEVIRGTLYCAMCEIYYPIEEGIPNLLPSEMR
ncbi:MAG: methytransferase partner Trm112 [Halobacteriota archaeon]